MVPLTTSLSLSPPQFPPSLLSVFKTQQEHLPTLVKNSIDQPTFNELKRVNLKVSLKAELLGLHKTLEEQLADLRPELNIWVSGVVTFVLFLFISALIHFFLKAQNEESARRAASYQKKERKVGKKGK